MALITVDLPPGMFRNGTPLQAQNRWRDGNLVRWVEGALQPQLGWLRRKDIAGADLQVEGAPRAAFIWRDNNHIAYLAIGTSSKLLVLENATTVVDVTPAGLIPGEADSSYADGYGIGDYGMSDYGTPREVDSAAANIIPAAMWTLQNWGENLIACLEEDGKLYEHVAGTSVPAPVIAGAPLGNHAFVVTNERILMALGAENNPRLIKWSDQENNTQWTPSVTNQAGDILLQTNGMILAGRATPNGVIVWTTEDVWIASYLGPPYVYGFQSLAGKATIVSKSAMAVIDSRVVWMGQRGFWIYDGGLTALSCEVGDDLFNHINVPQISKTWAMVNHGMNEVVWFYPSDASNEVDSYVTWNYAQNFWLNGKLNRTCGVPAGILPNPILLRSDGFVYNHATGYDYEGLTPYVTCWPIEIGNGERQMLIKRIIPDELFQGQVKVRFDTQHYPTKPVKSYGPYTMDGPPVNTRVPGREVAMVFLGHAATSWRVGKFKFDVVPWHGR